MYLISIMLGFSICIITIAHIIRILRWEFLIETYEEPNGKRLTRSLSLGYFLNYFLPFKIGDLFRAMYAGKGMENGRGFALATVIVERCLDILAVGVIFICFSLFGTGREVSTGELSKESLGTAVYYIVFAIILFVVLVVIYLLRQHLKKQIFTICELFNEKYEEKLLRFFWALIWGFKDIINRLPKIRLVIATISMWGLYLISYGVFSAFLEGLGINRSFTDVLFSLFDQKSLLSSGIVNGFNFSEETVWYALFMLVPTVFMFIVSVAAEFILKGKLRIAGNDNRLIKRDNRELNYENREKLNLIPQVNTDERLTFLKMYFAGEKKEYIENYLKINRNILVLRDYSAGSNATTILCTDGENSFYRKYAFMDAADKLSEQIGWIELYSEKLPLAKIIRKEVGEGVCFYDMPYYHDAVTLFEYSQSCEYDNLWNAIEGVVNELEAKLYSKKSDNLDFLSKSELIKSYVDEKILRNLDIIVRDKEISELLEYDNILINGKEYKNLSLYMNLLEKEHLYSIFEGDEVSSIHGDLTVENIVYNKISDSYYLIDPNTGNIFDSKFIDYAKLLQSLHGKYEYLMAVKDVYVSGNRIDFKIIESDAYEYIYKKYIEYLEEHFTKNQIRSIYYHEIANWLRLMPYKIKKGRGILFFSGLIKVLDEVEKYKL